MDLQKLRNVKKLRRDVADAIAGVGSIKQHDLISLAKRAGYVLDGQRGKENVYVHSIDSSADPLSIPDHGRDPNKLVAKGILQRIDEVLFNFEERLSNQQEVHDDLEDQSR